MKDLHKNKKCKGITIHLPYGEIEYDCEYNTTLDCDQCKYCIGNRDPEDYPILKD